MRRFPPPTIGCDVDRAFTRWTAPRAPRPVVGVDADDVLARAGLAPRLDLTTALLFLARDAYEARRTFFEGLELVPPYAEVVEALAGTPAFSMPAPRPCGLTDRAAAARALRERLDLAIEDRIVGAARVGIAASGGLDSTAVAVGASRVWRRLGRDPRDLRLYHVLPRTGPTEVAHAEALARSLGHDLVLFRQTAGDPFAGDETFLRAIDFPPDGGGTGGWGLVAARLREDGVSTVLTGDGGDEVVGPLAEESAPHGLWPRLRYAAGRACPPLHRLVSRRRLLAPFPRALAVRIAALPEPETMPAARPGLEGLPASRDRLVRCARQSMIVAWHRASDRVHGLTTEFPLLDRRVADLVVTLPPAFFGPGPKALLRAALGDAVPSSLSERPKDQPEFESLLTEDVRRHGDRWLERWGPAARPASAAIVSPAEAAHLLGAARTGDVDALWRYLALIGLLAWVAERGVAVRDA